MQKMLCVGLKDLGLKPGEKVKVMGGLDMEVEPDETIVVREFDTMVLLQSKFTNDPYHKQPVYIKECVSKQAMFCGHVRIRRLSDGVILTGEEAGRFGWVG